MSMPSSPQLAAIFWAFMSSPNTVSSRTSTSSRLMLWAMFRPTPPRDIWTEPGLESWGIRALAGLPPMSMFTPPTTVT